MTVRIGITGAMGRMGQALITAIDAEPKALLAGAIDRPGHPSFGKPVIPEAGIDLSTDCVALCKACDVVIDFSAPAALPIHLSAAVAALKPLVVGTTGLTAADHAILDAGAAHIPILQAANMSLGIAVLSALVRQAATTLGPDWDIEILEMHHHHKVDAPSGTALQLGAVAAAARGVMVDQVRTYHDGKQMASRARGAIGFASLRGGSVAGDHMVILAGEGERLELIHRADDRSIFARGAVSAALWLAAQPPGRYTINDMLALD